MFSVHIDCCCWPLSRSMIFVFLAFKKYKPLLSLCVLTDCSNLRSPSGFFANSTVSSAYLSSFTSFPCIFTALKLVSSPSASTLRMIVSVYMLNMGGESMQPCRTPRLTGNQSVKPLSSLTAANCSLYRLIIKFVHHSFRFLDRFYLSSLSLISEGAVSILDKDPEHCLESRDHLLGVVEAVTSSKDPLAAFHFQPSPAARTSVHVTLFGRLSGYSTSYAP